MKTRDNASPSVSPIPHSDFRNPHSAFPPTTTHPPKFYWKNCAALMALLALTWAMGYVNLGPFNLPLALAISVTKMILIVLFFMHINAGSRILHLAAAAGLIWFLLMMTLTLADYFSRDWVR